MKSTDGEKLVLGGKEYKTIKINNQLWMTENLELLVKDSWFYDDNALYGPQFGRLYSWEAALEACPKGWRLPSVEDWEQLISFYGGETDAYHQLLKGGESKLNIVFGGYRNAKGGFFSMERAADYWTSTPAGEVNSWLFYLIMKNDKVFKTMDDQRCGFSVRYIKDSN